MQQIPHLNEVIAKIVRERRAKLEMSKRMLSTLSRIDRVYIRGIESGKWNISVNVLFNLAEALEIDPVVFMQMIKDELEAINGKYWPFDE